jgi:hypothetical protein
MSQQQPPGFGPPPAGYPPQGQYAAPQPPKPPSIWYHHPQFVGVLLVFCCPVGLYLMWKGKVWSQKTRIIITGVIGLFGIVVNASQSKQTTSPAKTETRSKPSEQRPAASPTEPVKQAVAPSGTEGAATTAVASASASAPAIVDPVAEAKAKKEAEAQAKLEEEQKKADEKQRLLEEKKRLAARKFVGIGPEQLAMAILAKNDPDEMWVTQYKGKYVRWQGKWERGALIGEFIASAGDIAAFACEDFDPAHDPAKFTPLNPYDAILVEGRLTDHEKQTGKNKLQFSLHECIARKR